MPCDEIKKILAGYFLAVRKALRAGSPCGSKVKCLQGDPPQAENPAKQDSYSYYEKFSKTRQYSRECKFNRAKTEKKILGGMTAVKGTRIPISLITACLKDEMTIGEICEEEGLE